MKKTLTAIMLMSSVAFGASASDVNANLQSAITDYNYIAENGFSMQATIQLNGGSEAYFTFAENWKLYAQVKRYFGVTTGGDPGSWNVVPDGNTDPFTDNLVVGQSKSWIGDTNTDNNTVTITISSTVTSTGDDNQPQYYTFLTVTPSATGTSIISSMLLDSQGGTSAFYDLNDVVFNNNVTSAYLTIGANADVINLVDYVAPTPSTPNIPEPTTATLSLLALAGLAARRRRK